MKTEINSQNAMSQDTKTIITVLCLVIAYPVGLILMFVWMKWPWWVKLLCLLIFILPALIILSVLGVVLAAVLVSVNPSAQLAKAKEMKMKSDAQFVVTAIKSYYVENDKTPWGGDLKNEYRSSDIASEKWFEELVRNGYLMPSFNLTVALNFS
jgi:hypothetical protein